ncbi:MAG: PASTA domain-containing protein [Nitrospirae bacterium]|nr:PASTA domain-containing protein [Nitrospirota bacterium]MBF0535243.1 PASTA domain-containing protein [Nitrospirota bacterium]MBF0615277.1 PASTA domain-containing protein [Nitrospirota bacterium]
MKALLRVFVFFVLFVLVSLVTGYVTFNALTSSKSITVPDLTGKSLLEATGILAGVKLFLKIEGEDYSNAVKAGQIMKQNIPAGNKIKEGRTISVVMSKGQSFTDSDLKGLTLDKAYETAAQNKTKIDRVLEVHSDTQEKGTVIAQRPVSEEKGAAEIDLLVSAGPFVETYLCPDFIGKTTSYADKVADTIGIKTTVSGSGSKIISQKPQPDTMVKRGDTVSLQAEEEVVTDEHQPDQKEGESQ